MLNSVFYSSVLEMRSAGQDWPTIHKNLLKTKSLSTTTTVQDVKNRFVDLAAEVINGNEEVVSDEKSAYETAVDKINQYIGRKDKQVKEAQKTESKVTKILVISDVHVPNYEADKLKAALDIGKKEKCNTLVINGDFLNGDRLSSHAKFKHENFRDEIAEGRALLEKFCGQFETVYLLDDNHVHDRWRRFLGNQIAPDLHFLLTHPYDYMCNGLQNVKRSGELHDEYKDEISHCMFLGDAMFSHGFVSGKDGASVRTVKEWYSKWKPAFNFPNAKVFLHGHQHKLGINYDFDAAIIQTGTLANLDGLRYSMEGHLKGNPPIWGCTVLTQVDGVTDLSTIKVIKL